MSMKFAKLFNIYRDDEKNLHEKYISIEDVFVFLKKKDEKANKYNIKRSLQHFQGGSKIVCGKESATVLSVLKYFFAYANCSETCASVVKNIEKELLLEEKGNNTRSSLELYKQIAKTKLHQSTVLFEQIDVNERNILTLIVEHKQYFTSSEWKRICWFENDFSREINIQECDISYEKVLELKYSRFQSLLTFKECSKNWILASEEQIRQKNIRYEATEKENQIRISLRKEHIASILDTDFKKLADIYCPGSIGHIVTFDVSTSTNANSVWAVLFQEKDLQVDFNDLCSRAFYSLKRRHDLYLEKVFIAKSEYLKEYVSKDEKICRFFLRDSVETKQLKNVSQIWQAGTLIDGTIEFEEHSQCETCFTGILSNMDIPLLESCYFLNITPHF